MRNITILGIDIKGESYAIVAEREDIKTVLYSGLVKADTIDFSNVIRVCSLNSIMNIKPNQNFDTQSIVNVLKYDLPVITGELFTDVVEQVDCDDSLTLELSVSFRGTEYGYGAMLNFSSEESKEEWVQIHSVDLIQDLEVCISKIKNENELYELNRNKSLNGVSYIIAGRLQKELKDNLESFVERYDIVEWGEFRFSVPIMYFLKNGSLDIERGDCVKDEDFYKEYGLEENPVFRFPLMDHVFCFKDRSGKGYIVTNPYMSDGEIVQYMDCLNTKSSRYGDYSGIRYKIFGKGSSIYSKNDNMVVFSYGD